MLDLGSNIAKALGEINRKLIYAEMLVIAGIDVWEDGKWYKFSGREHGEASTV